jgi:hypothetical protein
MPLPSLENIGIMFVRAVQQFVKDVEEALSYIIQRIRETFEDLT